MNVCNMEEEHQVASGVPVFPVQEPYGKSKPAEERR